MGGEAAFQTHIMVIYNMSVTVWKTLKESRKRFSTGTSYRLMNQAQERTSTKKTVFKLLYVGEYLDLLQWTCLSMP